ncbi:MAG: gamma-glutamyl-gamma-aminobutyrate hydrolase family protein [Clostridiales bacterium]|nr:gamma-glutamyl-gamma-aminobutyrate hydrolase family protein [Clostridiales bacterium]
MVKIGLSTSQDTTTSREGMPPDYISAVLRAGALPLIFPILPLGHAQYEGFIDAMVRSVDAIIFTGGPDFDPVIYGQEKHPGCGNIHPERDEVDLLLARAAIKAGKPILGICRGLQLINVAMGGTLYQDLAAQLGFPAERHQSKERSAHEVKLEEDTLLRRITGVNAFSVNSRHHQAIERVGEGLRISARSEDGVIEAVEFESGYPGLALQWHPENLAEERTDQQALFHWLAGVAEQRR